MTLHLNPHHPEMLCAKFGWNWPGGWKCGKFIDRRTDRQKDYRRSEMNWKSICSFLCCHCFSIQNRNGLFKFPRLKVLLNIENYSARTANGEIGPANDQNNKIWHFCYVNVWMKVQTVYIIYTNRSLLVINWHEQQAYKFVQFSNSAKWQIAHHILSLFL